MRYCLESEVITSRGVERVVIPLVAIVQGGIRISMSDLLNNFLRHFKVCPDQCTLNAFRVVSSIDKLNERLCLKLTKHDTNYIYSFQESKTLRFYFKIRLGEVRLISSLLDSNKETEGDYLIISGNWYPNGICCPTTAGRAGGQKFQELLLFVHFCFI